MSSVLVFGGTSAYRPLDRQVRAGFTREGLLRAWLPTADGRRDSVMFSLLPT